MKLRQAFLLLAFFASPVLTHAETITLSALKDNTIYNDASPLSNGAGEFIHTGVTREGRLRRGLIAFDVAGNLPANAVITGVQLSLNMSQANSSTAVPSSLHRLLADWGEGTSNAPAGEGAGTAATVGDATFINRFHPDIPWTTPGGDFVPVASASTDVGGVGLYFWESNGMIADVQDWLGDPSNNFGWIIRTGNEIDFGDGKRFDSRTNPEAAFRPALKVDYKIVPEPATWSLVAHGLGVCLFVARRRFARAI